VEGVKNVVTQVGLAQNVQRVGVQFAPHKREWGVQTVLAVAADTSLLNVMDLFGILVHGYSSHISLVVQIVVQVKLQLVCLRLHTKVGHHISEMVQRVVLALVQVVLVQIKDFT
jgi:hypothetical protein